MTTGPKEKKREKTYTSAKIHARAKHGGLFFSVNIKKLNSHFGKKSGLLMQINLMFMDPCILIQIS